jgi:hypothetical protein
LTPLLASSGRLTMRLTQPTRRVISRRSPPSRFRRECRYCGATAPRPHAVLAASLAVPGDAAPTGSTPPASSRAARGEALAFAV